METTISLKRGSQLVNVNIDNDDGSKIEKTISIRSLQEIFSSQEKKAYYCLNPIFEDYEKAGMIKGLLYGELEESKAKGIFFVPADRKFMNVAGEKCTMPYPSLVFRLVSRHGSIVNSQCFAIKEKKVNAINIDSRLYAFPFGNVDPFSGAICWGNNNLKDLYGYEELRSAITTFFSSESNMDYVKQGQSYAKKFGDYKSFLNMLKTMDYFPVKTLVPSPCVHTLRELIEK